MFARGKVGTSKVRARIVGPLAVVLVAGALLASVTPTQAEVVVWKGATVHPVSGPTIDNGIVVAEDGKIIAIGDSSTAVPDGATVVDVSGKHVYPGFIHPASVLGLIEIGSVAGTRDVREMGDNNAHIRAEVAFNADSLLLPPTMAGGVLTAHVAPRGGVISGTSAAMRLDGWNWEDMTVETPIGMHVNLPRQSPFSSSTPEEQEEQKKKAMATLDTAFDTAEAYAKARKAADEGTGPALDFDPRYEGLIPVLDGELPVFLWASDKGQIETALDWAEKRGFEDFVLVAGSDAQYMAERLAEEEVPVILGGVLRLPERRWEPYDSAYVAASKLHAAGVKFCISDSSSSFGASNARNLPFHAAMAAAFGLPKDVALRSVTLSVAEVLGIDDRLGSLDVGKNATLMVTDGDPLEIMTHVERVWIEGREIDLSQDHQRRLYEKYRNRPRPEGLEASRLQ